jgi:hypothetical protein
MKRNTVMQSEWGTVARRRVGLTVTDANYGAEALILFTKGKFDLVVTVRQVAAVSASVLE